MSEGLLYSCGGTYRSELEQENSVCPNSGVAKAIVIKAVWHFPFFDFLKPCQVLTIFTATQIETSGAALNSHN